ncbi:hypothetical protein AYO42_01580 [Rhizomicrobium sp. SCGC AG-212-E05]|nr:hypothetical protein AYO42_01580 [Rhizomicrobium sp. SCGC AG-212-E05]
MCPMEQDQVIAFLADPATHHAVAAVKRLDTHGAHVFLVGNNAYKIKRAVRYPYMDFSTLERREKACRSEIAINRGNAPDIYLAAVPITRDEAGLHLEGSGEIVEWAVHMRRFDEELTFDKLARRGQVNDEIVDQLARTVSDAHKKAGQKSGFAPALREIIVETTEELEHAQEAIFPGRATLLGQHMLQAYDKYHCLLEKREREGKVRRCHGDLHLRNIVLHGGRPMLFDAIEFDEKLASIDILYDLAFLVMDLCQMGLQAQACRLLNHYLWLSDDEAGEIEGLALLPLFLALRAAIRAKVLISQAALDANQNDQQIREYVLAAAGFLSPAAPRLIAVGGLSGTGKTRLAYALAQGIGAAPGALHLRSDIERKKLFNISAAARLQPSAYDPAISKQVYQHLMVLGRTGLAAGRSVILDATFRDDQDRQGAVHLAADANVPFSGMWLQAPPEVRVTRVQARVGDASDATPEVAARQSSSATCPPGWTPLDAGGTPDATREIALDLLRHSLKL